MDTTQDISSPAYFEQTFGVPPAQAAEEAIAYLFHRLGGHGGIILLGPMGRIGVAHNTPRMAWGTRTARGMEVNVR